VRQSEKGGRSKNVNVIPPGDLFTLGDGNSGNQRGLGGRSRNFGGEGRGGGGEWCFTLRPPNRRTGGKVVNGQGYP